MQTGSAQQCCIPVLDELAEVGGTVLAELAFEC